MNIYIYMYIFIYIYPYSYIYKRIVEENPCPLMLSVKVWWDRSE